MLAGSLSEQWDEKEEDDSSLYTAASSPPARVVASGQPSQYPTASRTPVPGPRVSSAFTPPSRTGTERTQVHYNPSEANKKSLMGRLKKAWQ